MVRLGIGLYGIGSDKLQNCSALKSVISQIKKVPAGESVGMSDLSSLTNQCKLESFLLVMPMD